MKAVLAMTAVVMMNWMEQSHLLKRQQEVHEKLDTGLCDTPIL